MHSQKPLLTVSFTSGDISLMNNYDDLSPTLIRTGLKGVWVTFRFPCLIASLNHQFIPIYKEFLVKEFCVFHVLSKCADYFNLYNITAIFSPVTCAVDVVVQWCSQGDLLAVAGMERTLLSPDPSCPPPTRNAIVKFYNVRGEHIYTLDTPAQVSNF